MEDLSQLDAYSRTFANPDGTWTTEASSVPERVQEADGSWHDIDLTMVQDDDGKIGPLYGPVELNVSSGGDAEFATVGSATGDISFEWEDELPEPTLDGPRAVYHDVVDNGDLVVTATATGFSHSVVLREAPSAPVAIEVPVDADGAKIRQGADGTLEIRESGQAVVTAPQPLMWDSSHDPAEVLETQVVGRDGNQSIVLTPDYEYLTDPSTQYPVTVDPTFMAIPDDDTWIANNLGSQYADAALQVGTENGGTTKKRSFLKFAGSIWANRDVSSATLNIRNFKSPNCTNGAIRAARVMVGWNSGSLSWANQPEVAGRHTADYDRAWGATGCDAGDAVFDLTGIVRDWASGEYPNLGIRLAAVDETRNASFRKYRSLDSDVDPKLVVTYNTYPTAPSSGAFSDSQFVNGGWRIRSTVPTLSSIVTDADPGTSAAEFEITSTDGVMIIPFERGRGTFVEDGQRSQFRVPTGYLYNGRTYRIRARTTDALATSSPVSLPNFTIDMSLQRPVSISSASYPSDNSWNGAPGQAGTFTLTPLSSDTSALKYWVEGGQQTTVANTGQTASVVAAPTKFGLNTLNVQVVNAVGLESQAVGYQFLAGNLSGTASTSMVDAVIQQNFGSVFRRTPTVVGEDPVASMPESWSELEAVDDSVPSGFVEETDPESSAYEFTRPADTIAMPSTSAGLITQDRADATRADVTLTMPTTSTASTIGLGNSQLMIYPNTGVDSDTIVERLDTDHVETYHLLRTSQAPTQFSYGPSLSAGQSIVLDSALNTATIVDADSEPVFEVKAPVALDANGGRIPISLGVSSGVLQVTLLPQAGQTLRYPVLVDPSLRSGYGGGVTASEAKYCTGNPIACARAHSHAQAANDIYNNSISAHRGAADAGRHCYWNALMRINLSQKDAYQIATRHESTSRAKDKEMDLHNNSAGRRVASRLLDDSSLSDSERETQAQRTCSHWAAVATDDVLWMQGSWRCPVSDWAAYNNQTPIYYALTPETCIDETQN